jgi:hypothetical protein
MPEELRIAIQQFISAADALLDELGYQGVGGREAQEYDAARARVLELAPEAEPNGQ